MNSQVLRIHQIDLNKINYLKIKDIGNKKQIFIDYEKFPLVFQCPSLLNENFPIKITDDYYELELPLITHEKSKQNNFINFLKNLDSKITQDANNNVKIWFNQNKMSYSYKTIVKDSDKYKNGTIKLKIIKTINFESMLFLENNKKINIKDIPKDSWTKILLEVHSIIINNENKTFYLFLRPHAFSFKEKQVNLNYTFLDDSDSEEEIPDSDTNNIFLKQTLNVKSCKNIEGQTSSQINYDLKNLELTVNSKFSSSSSDEEIKKHMVKSDENKIQQKLSDFVEEIKKTMVESDKNEIQQKLTDFVDDLQKTMVESDENEIQQKLTDFVDDLQKTIINSEEESNSYEGLKNSSDSEESNSYEGLKKLSDSEENILSDTTSLSEKKLSSEEALEKIYDTDENKSQFKNKFISHKKKKLLETESETSSNNIDNNIEDSINLVSRLQRT